MATCRECRCHHDRKRCDQIHCSTKCNQASSNREMTRARALYRCLYWWRYGRLAGPSRSTPAQIASDLLFICRSIALWIQEDKMHQRLPPARHDHGADRGALRKTTREMAAGAELPNTAGNLLQ